VNAYAPGAHGDVAPFAILAGRNAGLTNPQGLVVRDGLLYVASGPFGPGAPGVPSVTVFTLPLVPEAGAPIAVIAGPATGLDSPFGLALDASGNIYAANLNNTVTVYAPPPPSSHGTPHDVPPILTIAAGLNGPEGVAISGNVLYVATDDNTIARFSLPTGAPGAVIAGPDTRLHQPLGIDVDSSGRIFVVNTGDEVLTFAPDAAGNVAPIAVLAGPATGFNGVQFVAVGLGDASS
ncbi:MAG: hypothetical protein M3N98_00985, partial [Actinomycetota bacterium]|nr:hypothetical protein [Actinomycetota bacterium]